METPKHTLSMTHLCYYPGPVSTEHTIVAIVAEDELKNRYWCTTSNWERLEAFDPRLDMKTFKGAIGGIYKEIFKEGAEPLPTFISHFVNNLRFDEIKTIEAESIEDTIGNEVRTWLPAG